MKKLLLTIGIALISALSVQAQIGWTLEQCREHFGAEFLPADGNTHYFHVGPVGRGLGEHVYITLDPDGTVGGIQWLKLDGKPFSEGEIQQRLKEASRVSWERTADAGPDGDELNWIGTQKGKIIFTANEGNNGRGTWILSIWTK